MKVYTSEEWAEAITTWTFIAFLCGGIVGWILNIVRLVSMDVDRVGLLALRIIGVLFPPLGAVVGFIP